MSITALRKKIDAPSQNLPGDVLARIAEIVYYMQTRQYQKANDSYLRLSIRCSICSHIAFVYCPALHFTKYYI